MVKTVFFSAIVLSMR